MHPLPHTRSLAAKPMTSHGTTATNFRLGAKFSPSIKQLLQLRNMQPPPYLLEALCALVLIALLIVITFEVWLLGLALTIISRTPVLRRLVAVEVRPAMPAAARRRTWAGWKRQDSAADVVRTETTVDLRVK